MFGEHKNLVKNQLELETLLKSYVDKAKGNIIVHAGHLPIVPHIDETGQKKIITLDHWGPFSEHTFDLGAKAVAYAKDQGKTANLAIIVDDYNLIAESEFNGKNWVRTKKRAFFKQGLPKSYLAMLDQYGLSEQDVLSQDHKKPGREDSKMFSENILIANGKQKGIIASSQCGKAYRSFLAELVGPNDNLISFVPAPCYGNICDKVLPDEKINALHAFFLAVDKDNAFGLNQVLKKSDDLYQPGKVIVTYNDK